jgi:hypothetical protein
MRRITHRARSLGSRRLAAVLAGGAVIVVAVATVAMAEQAGTSGAAGHSVASGSDPPGAAAVACVGSDFTAGRRSWPDCANTGVPPRTALRAMTSPGPTGRGDSYVTEITKKGTVIDGVNLTGSFDVYANDVTIENSRITTRNWWGINLRHGYTGLKVLHDTIIGVPGKGIDHGGEDYGVSSSGGNVEVGWTNISEVGEGVSMSSGYVHDSYVHNLQAFKPQGSSGYEHTDDIISDGGSGLTIKHNTLLNQLPADRGASASVGLYADNGPPSDDVVDDNFMAGGAYAIYPGGPSGSRRIVVEDNVFSTIYWRGSGIYGPVSRSYWHSGEGNRWTDNFFVTRSKVGRAVKP